MIMIAVSHNRREHKTGVGGSLLADGQHFESQVVLTKNHSARPRETQSKFFQSMDPCKSWRSDLVRDTEPEGDAVANGRVSGYADENCVGVEGRGSEMARMETKRA